MTHSSQPDDLSVTAESGRVAAQPGNWKLTLSYDGTEFSGWQVQPGERTVQGELQAALGRVAGERPLPQGSGRTDAGVHALGQVASFELAANIPADNLQRALNRTLPPAIRVVDATRVQPAFHARHAAVTKTYEYRVFRGSVCPPFMARYVHACTWPMDFEALQEAAQYFIGEHDFLSFAATDPDLTTRSMAAAAANSPEPREVAFPAGKHGSVRTVYASAWTRESGEAGDLLVYRIRGNGFLHHMVRNLVGTMIDVGRGRTHAAGVPAMLAARSRDAAGPNAPALGLFLHSVEYGGADSPLQSE